MKRFVMLLAVAVLTASANTKLYDIAPYKCVNGFTSGGLGSYVGETFVACADSLLYAEVFFGQKPETLSPNGYLVRVMAGDTALYEGNATDTLQWAYVRANLTRIPGAPSLVRGRTYLLNVSHTGAQRVNYFFDPRNSYSYGAISAGGGEAQPPPQTTDDLVCRVVGRMNPVDPLLCGMDDEGTLLGDSPAVRDSWVRRAREAGVGAVRRYLWWQDVESRPDTFWFAGFDTALVRIVKGDSCGVLACLCGCPKWASTRVVTRSETDSLWPQYQLDTCVHCAPRSLDVDPGSDSNHWAHYLRALIKHTEDTATAVCCTLHAFEIWNEPTDGDTIPAPGFTGWWQHPNQFYVGDSFSPLAHDTCYLYMKMCHVAAQVIRASGPHHANDKIIIGSTARVTDSNPPMCGVKGSEWIRLCYEIAEEKGWDIFWDGVSVHPYQDDGLPTIEGFDPVKYESDADTIRSIMRHHDHPGGELWNTEFSWDTANGSEAAEQSRARNFTEAYVSTKASEALPQGSFDRAFWWAFREDASRLGNFPLLHLDPVLEHPYKLFYACKQMMNRLTGKRLNGRVMTGDASKDSAVRMYEFQDPATLKRTWVAWKNGGAGSGGLSVKLPVRTDSLAAESLAYTGTPSPFSASVAPDGWLSLSLNERPAFVTEVTDTLRPDLRVDSVKYNPSPGPMYVKAWVTNHGSRATPRNPSGTRSYPTWAVLSRNGDSLAQQVCTDSIAVGHQVEFKFTLTSPPSNSTLFSVRVNPLQTYAELGTDDNTGHALAVRP